MTNELNALATSFYELIKHCFTFVDRVSVSLSTDFQVTSVNIIPYSNLIVVVSHRIMAAVVCTYYSMADCETTALYTVARHNHRIYQDPSEPRSTVTYLSN